MCQRHAVACGHGEASAAIALGRSGHGACQSSLQWGRRACAWGLYEMRPGGEACSQVRTSTSVTSRWLSQRSGWAHASDGAWSMQTQVEGSNASCGQTWANLLRSVKFSEMRQRLSEKNAAAEESPAEQLKQRGSCWAETH
jgi:hypothetical protein